MTMQVRHEVVSQNRMRTLEHDPAANLDTVLNVFQALTLTLIAHDISCQC